MVNRTANSLDSPRPIIHSRESCVSIILEFIIIMAEHSSDNFVFLVVVTTFCGLVALPLPGLSDTHFFLSQKTKDNFCCVNTPFFVQVAAL